MRCVWLALILLVPLAARAEGEDPGEAIGRAMRDLRYADARVLVDGALKRGGLPRAQLLALQATYAELTAILDGPEAGEREFRRLLVIDPQRPPPRRSPVVLGPYERAQRFAGQHGAIAATLVPISPTEVEVRVQADPLAMVAGAHIYHRVGDDGPFRRVPGLRLRATLLAPPADQPHAVFAELVDAAENVLVELGSADAPTLLPRPPAEREKAQPLAVVAPPPPPAPKRKPHLLYAGIGLGAASLGVLGAAIGLAAAAVAEYGDLSRRCAPMCSDQDLATFRGERNASYALYAVAGAGLVSALVMIIVDRVRAAHGPR